MKESGLEVTKLTIVICVVGCDLISSLDRTFRLETHHFILTFQFAIGFTIVLFTKEVICCLARVGTVKVRETQS